MKTLEKIISKLEKIKTETYIIAMLIVLCISFFAGLLYTERYVRELEDELTNERVRSAVNYSTGFKDAARIFEPDTLKTKTK